MSELQPVFFKDHILSHGPMRSGAEKRTMDVTLQGEPGHPIPAVLKFMKPIPVGGMRGILDEDERLAAMQREIQDLQLLRELIHGHVPAILGVYSGHKQQSSGFLVERIMGHVVGNEYGEPIFRIPIRKVDKFISAIQSLKNHSIYLNDESVSPHNLMYGKTESAKQNSVYLLEPKIISAKDENFEATVQRTDIELAGIRYDSIYGLPNQS